LWEAVTKNNKDFEFGKQADANTFLLQLIDSLPSSFGELFSGISRTWTQCTHCGHSSKDEGTNDTFFSLSVALPAGDTDHSLDALLRLHASQEDLSTPSKERWKCSKKDCKASEIAKSLDSTQSHTWGTTRRIIHEGNNTKPMLVVAKRFGFDEASKKIASNVLVDMSGKVEVETVNDLGVSSFVSRDLTGVICHIGNTLNSGHFTSCVKLSDKWYLFNDSDVTLITFEEVRKLATEGYVFSLSPVRPGSSSRSPCLTTATNPKSISGETSARERASREPSVGHKKDDKKSAAPVSRHTTTSIRLPTSASSSDVTTETKHASPETDNNKDRTFTNRNFCIAMDL
jgi:ubiquitin C-terminal hydrolase